MHTYSSKVFKGDQLGRTIGFPTVNLDVSLIPVKTEQGVWASQVTHNGKKYLGALYFGPRLVLNETKLVLEIFILDFGQEIYGDTVEFTLEKFVRGILDFDSLELLQAQLEKDVIAVIQWDKSQR